MVGTTAQGPAPGAPTGLTATAGVNGVTLRWTAPMVNEENSAPDFYAYQQTTLATGDVKFEWKDPGDPDIVNYQYRQASVTPGQGEPDFSGATWQDITDSTKDTTSFSFNGVDTTIFFDVQYVKSDTTTGTVAVTRTDTLNFAGAVLVRMDGGGSITSNFATGLAGGTIHYFRVRAGNVNGDGDWSESASATPRNVGDGVWTYVVQFDPPSISPGNTSRLQVVATFTAAESDRAHIRSLTGGTSGFGALSASLPNTTPEGVGFDDGNPSTPLDLSTSHTVAAVDCSGVSFTLTCTITFGERLKAGSSGSYIVTTAVTSPFSITPVVNGINGNAASPTSTDLDDATLRVASPSGGNRRPVARGSVPDRSLVESDDPLRIDVKDKFRDPDRDRLTYAAESSDASVATVSVDGSMVIVTPVGAGTATITVTAKDPDDRIARQRFYVTVERARKPGPPDTPDTPDPPEGPVAEEPIGARSMTEGGAAVTINVAGNFSDPNGDELTYTASSSDESVATVSVDGGMVTVTPIDAGTATITVIARDPGGEAATQRFMVTAQRVNLAPVPEGSINVQRSTEGGATVTNDVAGNFSDANGDQLTYTARSSDASVATVSVDGSMVTVTPVGAGTATITVTARDPGGESATQRFTVTVQETNLAPVPDGSINGQRLTEGGDAVTIDVTGNFSDADGDELTYTASSSDASVATVSVDGSMVTVTPVGAGTATITVIARDPGGKAAFQRFMVTAQEANLAPVPEGSINAQGLTEGGDAVTINVAGNFSDANGDELAYTAESSDASVATVSVDGSMVTVTPVGAGTATITVTVQDPADASTQQNFSADVEASNEPPQASGTIATDDLVEDGEPARLDVSGNFTDPNGDSLTFEAQSSDESVATVSMDGSTVTVTPVGAGTASITVTASDSEVAGATQSFTVTVDPTPTPPTPPTPATATPAPPATATPLPATATPPPPATATPPPPATATPPPTLVTLPPPEDGGLPLGAIIVIAVGAISVVAVLVGFVALRMRR